MADGKQNSTNKRGRKKTTISTTKTTKSKSKVVERKKAHPKIHPKVSPDDNRKPRFDYDGDVFYAKIEALAKKGAINSEIAVMLRDEDGRCLHPDTFSKMLNGKYDGWTKEENIRRSLRMCQTLRNAREEINAIVRSKFLQTALGGIKLKTQSVVTRQVKIEGHETPVDVVQTTSTETETAPNQSALATWLHNFDEDWRRRSQGLSDNGTDPDTPAEKGIDISQWIDQEMKQMDLKEEE